MTVARDRLPKTDARADRNIPRALRTTYELLWGGLLALVSLLLSPLVRHRYNRWGATDAELGASMPGDELVARPKLGYTRAITIDAPSGDVWRWLAQFGQARGGFYSFDGLENIIGCRIHSTDRLLPEHQVLREGDLVRSGPEGKGYAAWQVVDVAPPDHLVLMGADPGTGRAPPVVTSVPDRGYVASTWQWRLHPRHGGDATRLVVRQRLTYSPRQALLWHLVEPLNFVMERAMLCGLRQRAEQTAGTPPEDEGP